MKKIIAVASMAAALAGAASAEIGFGMWGRSYIEMFNYSTYTEKSTAVAGPDWSKTGRVGVSVWGHDDGENVGFDLGTAYTGLDSTIGIENIDQAKMWAQLGPARFTIGKFQEDDLRGSGAFDDFYFGYGLVTRDEMFHRFEETGAMHIDLSLDGLYLAAAVHMGAGSTNAVKDIGDFYSTIQFAAAYHIDGVGQIKGQLVGNGFDKKEYLNFGFITDNELVDGLLLEIGSTIRVEDIADGGLAIPVGVKYTGIDNVVLRFQAEYINDDWVNGIGADNTLRFGLDGMYTMDNIDLGLATTFKVGLGASDADVAMNFAPFVGYHIGEGFIYVGGDVNVYITSDTNVTFGIPVGMQMSL